jgi:hypothetical protein
MWDLLTYGKRVGIISLTEDLQHNNIFYNDSI